MFSYADQDNDGQISYSEFQVMINPPRPRETTKPDIGELHSKTEAARKSYNLNGANGVNSREKQKDERRRRRTIVEDPSGPPVHSAVTRTTEQQKQQQQQQQHDDNAGPPPEGSPLPLSLENIKLHEKMTSNLSLRK